MANIKIANNVYLRNKKKVLQVNRKFSKKWQKNDRVVCDPFIKKQRWWVDIERPYTSARKLLKENLFDVNLGNHLNKLKDQVKILSGKQLANSRYATFWTDYLSKTPPWQR